jgi:hypothetical protein
VEYHFTGVKLSMMFPFVSKITARVRVTVAAPMKVMTAASHKRQIFRKAQNNH